MAAVSFLNTSPLVWGMLHGPQRGMLDLDFCVPSECADRLRDGRADIGIVPVVEVARQGLGILTGPGIACRGAVRSILLFSRVPFTRIRTLAADTSSRTSVVLSRIILQRSFGADPHLIPMAPDLDAMLRRADAALIIGDPALRCDPASLPYKCLDLGAAWWDLTCLPMVFAVWACRQQLISRPLEQIFRDSCRFGRNHLDDIVDCEAPAHGVPRSLAREYLTRHIVYLLGEGEYEGMRTFLNYAGDLEEVPA